MCNKIDDVQELLKKTVCYTQMFVNKACGGYLL